MGRSRMLLARRPITAKPSPSLCAEWSVGGQGHIRRLIMNLFQVAFVKAHDSKVHRSNHPSVESAMSTYELCLKMYPGSVAVVQNICSGKMIRHSDHDKHLKR